MDCSFLTCRRPASPQLSQPICAHHAREVYLAVKDMVESVTVEQRVASARSPRAKASPQQKTTERGWIYFMLIGHQVKIGYSTNVRQRAAALGATRVIGTLPGTRMDERQMHVRFGASWLGREMFRADPDVIAFADTLGRPDLDIC